MAGRAHCREVRFTVDGAAVALADRRSRVAVLVAPPWGPLGGSLSDRVVAAAVAYLQGRGLTTLRCNLVGAQVGGGAAQVAQLERLAAALLDGSLQAAAAAAADTDADAAAGSDPAPPTSLILCGYSYGALIASSASAAVPQVIGTVAIAPPFGVAQWLLLWRHRRHLRRAAERPDLHRLLLLGDRDQFTGVAAFRRTVAEVYPPERVTAVLLPQLDHFLAGPAALRECLEAIGDWIEQTWGWRDLVGPES